MAVVFDAKTATVTSVNGAALLDVANMTVGASLANGVLIAMIGFANSTAPAGLTAVWDNGGANQAMTVVPNTNSGTHGGFSGSAAMFALLNPIAGNKTLRFSWTGNFEAHAVAVSFQGVDQTSVAVACPGGTVNFFDTAQTSPATITVTSAAGDMVVACNIQNFSPIGVISGTTIAKDDTTGPAQVWAGSYSAGAATVTSTFAFTGTGAYGCLSCDVKAAGGAAAAGPGLRRASIFRPGQGPSRGLATPLSTYIPPVSATGAASGVGTVAAVGASLAAGVGASTGVGTVTGVGRDIANSVGASSGVGTVVGVGQNISNSVGASSGVGTVTGVGQDIANSVGASSGVGTAGAVGQGLGNGVGASSGIGTAGAAGQGIANSVGASSGVGTVVGVSSFTAITNVAGLWPASIFRPGQGPTYGLTTPRSTFIAPTGASAGASIVMAVGQAVFNGVAATSGLGTATAASQSTAASAAIGSGLGTAVAAGQALVPAVASSAGIGTVAAASIGGGAVRGFTPYNIFRPGQGPSMGLRTPYNTFMPPFGAGISVGVGTALGVAQSLVASVATASGVGTVAAAGLGAAPLVGASSGVGSAAAIGRSISNGVATSNGVGTAQGFTGIVAAASGISVVAGVGRSSANTVATASGVGAAAGVGRALTNILGASSGVGVVTGVGGGRVSRVGTASGTSAVVGVGVMAYAASTGMFILTGVAAPVIVGGAVTLATGFFKLTGEDAHFTGLPVLWVPQPIPFPGWTPEIVSFALLTRDGLPIILEQNDTVLTAAQPTSWVSSVSSIPDWVTENVSYSLLTQDGLPILLEQTDDHLLVGQPTAWVPAVKPVTTWTLR